MRQICSLLLAFALLATLAGCARQETEDLPGVMPGGMDTSSSAVVGQTAEGTQAPLSGELSIAIACGVLGPYGEIKQLFTAAHPDVKISQEPGNIVTLADMLREGKTRADLFMTVGSTALGKMEEEGLLLEAPIDFAEDELVVVVPKGNPAGVQTVEDLGSDKVKTLAIAKSKSTPGHFAEMTLQRAGVWDAVQERLVRPDQPSMLKGYVARQKADAAIMLLTCATKEAGLDEEPAEGIPGAEVAFKVPHEHYDRLACQFGIMKDAIDPELAREFIEFTRSPEAQKILANWDFIPCEAGRG